MMGEPVLLTIAIPTYNRGGHLQKQLDRLISQIRGRQDVEVLVCDNASEDSTPAVIAEARAECGSVRAVRHARNLGLDLNVYSAFERARGDYVWFLADDDIVEEAAVAKVVAEIERSRPAVLTMGARDVGATNAFDSHQKDADYTGWDGNAVAQAFLSVIMLSRLIVQKRAIQLDDVKQLPPTIFPQVTLCLRILNQRFALSIRSELVINRLPGHVTKNFFELYCLGVRRAARYAQCEDGLPSLLRVTEGSLHEFVNLQWLERLGYYESRAGLPLVSWRNGWKEFTGWRSRGRLLVILAISRTPRTIARSVFLALRILRTGSFVRAWSDLHDLSNWRNQLRSADV